MTIKWPYVDRAPQRSYLDFEIQLFELSGRFYSQVLHSPAGDTSIGETQIGEILNFVSLTHRLRGHFDVVGAIKQRSGRSRRHVTVAPHQVSRLPAASIEPVGRALFDFLFTGTTGVLYHRSIDIAEERGKGLRLKLRISTDRLAALPWEFIFDPARNRYLGLWPETPLVRYFELRQPPRLIAVKPPLRILVVTANPGGQLHVDSEVTNINQALEKLKQKGRVKLPAQPVQTLQELQKQMSNGQWNVFHYIGHGGFDHATGEGYIILDDKPLEANHLASLLSFHKDLRFAFLNSCNGASGSDFNSTATALIKSGVPAVLAMQFEITDEAAIEFSRVFYEALAGQWPLDAAATEGRKAIHSKIGNTPEWGTPVLYSRSPDGEVFVEPPKKITCVVIISLVIAFLVALVGYFSIPVPRINNNINTNTDINTHPVKPAVKIGIDRVLGSGVFRRVEGHIENLPEEAKIWLFRRNDGTGLWANMGEALIERGSWFMDVPIRPLYQFPHQFEIAALVSEENFPPNAGIAVLPSEGVSFVQSGAVPQPEYSIARINGIALQGTARCVILQWQQNTLEGRARHVFKGENIWVNIFGQDESHIQTGKWASSATVNPDGQWTANVKINNGQSFEIYVVISPDDPGADSTSQGVPVRCAGR
jgi:hypothetical protein